MVSFEKPPEDTVIRSLTAASLIHNVVMQPLKPLASVVQVPTGNYSYYPVFALDFKDMSQVLEDNMTKLSKGHQMIKFFNSSVAVMEFIIHLDIFLTGIALLVKDHTDSLIQQMANIFACMTSLPC